MKDKKVSGIVLAGGNSSRMGQDKCDLIYGGKTLLNHQIEKIKALGIDDICISGYKGKDCKEKVYKDSISSLGPLSGIYTCLNNIKYSKALVISVDTPLVKIMCLNSLIDESLKTKNQITYVSHSNIKEPLIAVYDVNVVDDIKYVLSLDNHCVMALFDRVITKEYISKDNDIFFSNINYKEDYLNLIKNQYD